jgi:hypothetical protein
MKRKLPTSVTVGGIRFQIVCQPIEDDDHGRMLFDERKILINTFCLDKASLLRETLRHEMLHAALHVSGVAFMEYYDEEVLVRAIDHIFFPAWDTIREKL